MKVAVDSLGCKLNQAEMEILARQFADAGYSVVSPSDKADVYILNTCTVTHIADRKSRQWLRQVHRRYPDARLVAIGCYAERAAGELAQIEGVGLVLGNQPKSNLVQRLEEAGYLKRTPLEEGGGRYYHSERSRAFIKVQDGCNNFCSYCIVPLVHSVEASVPVDQVIAEVGQRVADGCQEVVLTGTEIGAYDCNGANLTALLGQILTETTIARLRLSSLQPPEISPELIELWRDKRLCPHFHLSLQSGSNGVLSRMRRRYTTAGYQQAVSLIRRVVSEAAITTDVIVGFPGETEAEFEESYNFCRQMEFTRIHVFPYSPRPGTEAARMLHRVPDSVKKQRGQRMLALAEECADNFRRRFLGSNLPVLWEQQGGDGVWTGLTGNYIKVYTRSGEDLTNRLHLVKLTEVSGDGVWEEIT